MKQSAYDYKRVIKYTLLCMFGVFIFLLGASSILKNSDSTESKYRQDVYDLKMPNRNCKLYIINIIGERETKVIDCDGVISAPIQTEHHSTSHGAFYTNDVTPIVIKDK